MQDSVIESKSMEYAVKVVQMCKRLREEKREYDLTGQLLRSGTSIGANVREAKYAQSRADFVSKMSIALKEASETEYWIELLYRTEYVKEEQYELMRADIGEIAKLLTSIVKSSKEK